MDPTVLHTETLRQVAKDWMVSLHDLISQDRHAPLCEARADAAARLDGLGLEPREIAPLIHRDRTTVYYYLRR